MSNTVNLSCTCGKVKGTLQVVKGDFFHVQCLCCDCQAFAAQLNKEEAVLDEHGGIELFQTYPAYMNIVEGQENIGCIQLREKGLHRWYTTCCNLPLANTMSSSNVPFVGVPVKLMQFGSEQEKLEVLGPVTLKAFGKYAKGDMPKDAHKKFPLSFIPKIMGFMLKGLLTKKNTPSPFFKNGETVIKPEVLTHL